MKNRAAVAPDPASSVAICALTSGDWVAAVVMFSYSPIWLRMWMR